MVKKCGDRICQPGNSLTKSTRCSTSLKTKPDKPGITTCRSRGESKISQASGNKISPGFQDLKGKVYTQKPGSSSIVVPPLFPRLFPLDYYLQKSIIKIAFCWGAKGKEEREER
jgi:hypothetical protein